MQQERLEKTVDFMLNLSEGLVDSIHDSFEAACDSLELQNKCMNNLDNEGIGFTGEAYPLGNVINLSKPERNEVYLSKADSARKNIKDLIADIRKSFKSYEDLLDQFEKLASL